MMDSQPSKGEYNLKWNNHTANLIQICTEHQHNEGLVDVTLSCEGHFIKAHKLVLSACSLFFQEMFHIHNNIPHPIILLNGVKLKDLQQVVEFIYKGEIKVVESDLQSLLAVGEYLQVKGLSSIRIKAPEKKSPPVKKTKDTDKKQISPSSKGDKRQHNIKQDDSAQNTNLKFVHNETIHHEPKLNITEQLGIKKKKNEEIPPKKRRMSHLGNSNRLFQVKQTVDNATSSTSPTKQDSPERTVPVASSILPAPVPELDKVDEVIPLITSQKSPNVNDTGEHTRANILKKRTKKDVDTSHSNFSNGNSAPINDSKIPRPPNAFMIFATEWRKKLSVEHPNESNKGISILLGNMWKSLSYETKESYYEAARKADEEHKRKYPGYYYSPKEARIRKAATSLGEVKMKKAGSELNKHKVVDALHFVKLVMSEDSSGEATPEYEIQDCDDRKMPFIDISDDVGDTSGIQLQIVEDMETESN